MKILLTRGKTKRSFKINQNGFTLVQIMVSLTISSILIAGVLQIVYSSATTNATTSELATMQETARFVIDRLTSEIRMAGYLGCADSSDSGLGVKGSPGALSSLDYNQFLIKPPESNANATPLIFSKTKMADVYVTGVDGNNNAARITLANWTNQTPITTAPVVGESLAAGSDVLIIQRATRTGSAINDITGAVITSPNNQLSANDIGIVTDCFGVAMFYASERTENTITLKATNNTSTKLQPFSNTRPPELHRFNGYAYYIGYLNDDPSSMPVLYRADLYDPNGSKIEVARGVENIQIEYGITSNNGNSINYLSADAVDGLDNPVISTVRFSLVMRSAAALNPTMTEKTYTMLQENITTNDRYMRSVFTGSAKVRNKRLI